MDTGDFERELRNRMKARAAELDGSTPPAPRLTTLLVGVDRPRNRDRKGRFGLAFALVGVAALILAVVVPRWFGTYSGDAQPGNVTPSVGLNIVSSPAVRNSTASVPDTQSPSVSPDPLRYSDGIPRVWEGDPVLRGQAAIDAANRSSDSASFLVAFWAGIEGPHSCLAMGGNDNALYVCGGMGNVGDQPGLVSGALGMQLRVDTRAVAPGPVIARVHTHDPSLMNCPISYADGCEHVMVGDRIGWSGDQATAPYPTTVAQAAAAFGLPAKPSSVNVCMAAGFTGAPVLEFPSNGASGGMVEGVVVVFPSAGALAAADPSAAANGESDVPPIGHSDCPHTGYDPLRSAGVSTFTVHWMARGNILVGVQYDSDLGSNADPFVTQARASLSTLAGN